MNTGEQIANKAREGIVSNWAVDIAGWCSRFVRQVVEQAGIPTKGLFGASAIETEKNFKRQNMAFGLSQIGGVSGLQKGDILFQGFGSGGFGHTGVYLGGGQVAENSTRGQGGKMITSLEQFGQITSVGRFTDPYSKYASKPFVKYDRLRDLAGMPLKDYVERQKIEDQKRLGIIREKTQEVKQNLVVNPIESVKKEISNVTETVASYGPDILAGVGGAILLIIGLIALANQGR